ncbi:MAG: ATP synthase F1 subunit delta [Candidatus Komeilibacteria bacterium]|nr:ATP synthase F1 subunit delta [Candidatus Komeilibacteria bacterium]
MKKRNPIAYARALYEATLGLSGEKLGVVIGRFVSLLAKHQMLKSSSRIITEFERLSKERAGIMEIQIIGSRELPAATVNQIKKVFGEKVEATMSVEPALLGGVVVKTKDTILDGSLRTQLNNLKVKLAS